ncbi:hypothetical protein H3Z85_08660 [Chryseobacterium indologenes]|uniref:Uncharacterized protein n=1 Tax=Chryseobacterium indologenes TaxID=253 RepID=A0A1Z3W6V2_CHRID|nr:MULTISPECIES: hypothetical protein [Chryseobacterium]ASE63476.1 hypothetical protein CEQ15_19325 [Chryseobacterium indologenes]ATN07471.1 hypothetical protein CRN76_19765 [Chryseobacterium indologenes]AYY83791.1 hypothetical protein EGX91_04060 [Chryseobacterium indologenes]AYZ37609.1 hypothetical protein EGY07_19710 [Chryseobacterium indologenes]AZB19190.1 hypothetical protein EG352_16115 [Chryseobacterium indologenes]
MNNHRERLKILVALSDKLWEDYSEHIISEEEYLKKIYLVKKEINNGFIGTMEDLNLFTKDLGYLVLMSPTKTFLGGSDKIIINRN